MTALSPVWIGRTLRIDPQALPARFKVPTEAGASSLQDASVYLDDRGVVVKRSLSGLPLTLSLPLEAYEGVAVRVVPEGALGVTASVELMHRDPALSLPLLVTRDMEAAAEDWQAWAKALKMPMLVVGLDGLATAVATADAIPMDRPLPRRRINQFRNRRPRFLVRRKTGAKGPLPVLRGLREIIAPE
ncbi:DUF6101 family protein [Chthonobacter rhizosphaerae]|uniref:DUF6101 family protein n=1 Tax=Chthonobacter rhizosphaerae TaxID=2735553 RepID=UPI0015EFDB3C|nr:DUF6101 family protein [Chthonobacter rhizosphaerae]